MTPVVLVHGGMHGSWCWDPVLPLLAAPHVAVDLPGRGRRPAELATVSLDDAVQAVLDDADAAGFDRFVLVGHSLGGVTITETAVRHPAAGGGAGLRRRARPRAGPVGCRAHDRHAFGADAGAGRGAGTCPVRHRDGRRDLVASTTPGLVPDAPGLMNARLSGYPSGLPVTYVSMTLDAPVPPQLAERMSANLGPDVQVEVVPEAGHTIMTTHPDRIATIINAAAGG